MKPPENATCCSFTELTSSELLKKLQIALHAVCCVGVSADVSVHSAPCGWQGWLNCTLVWTNCGFNMSVFACIDDGAHDIRSQTLFVCCLSGGNHYTGPLQCAQDIVRREGARGLLRGWTAQYVRLGPQTTVIFVVMEELRKLTGLGTL